MTDREGSSDMQDRTHTGASPTDAGKLVTGKIVHGRTDHFGLIEVVALAYL